MAKSGRAHEAAQSPAFVPAQAPRGSVRICAAYAGELVRHRIITADGQDVAVATSAQNGRFVTAAYPVQHGYLVMVRQPICVLGAADETAALASHDKLVRVLAEAGVGVVRARRALAARKRAEHRQEQQLGNDTPGVWQFVGHQANAEEFAVMEIDLA